MADANQIMGTYGRLLRKNVRLNALAEKAWSYKDAHEFGDDHRGMGVIDLDHMIWSLKS